MTNGIIHLSAPEGAMGKTKAMLLKKLELNHSVSLNGKSVHLDLKNECVWGCNEYGVDCYISSSYALKPAIRWLTSDTSTIDEYGI